MRYGFGVDLGGTTVKLAFFDRAGNCLDKWEIPTVTAQGGKQILPDIASSIRDYIARHAIAPEDLIGIGVGVPGPVLPDGTVDKCVNLGWGQKNIPQELTALTGLTVKAGNDANMAALGEYWKGSGQGYDSMILITLGTGVGGGIVLNNKVLHGVHGAGGELGHITIDPTETQPCGCGRRGCAEQYLSATGILRQAKEALEREPGPSALRYAKDLTCKDVFDAAAAGDRIAQQVLEQVYDRMAAFLSTVCCVVDPEIILFGGGVSKAGQPLLDGIGRHFSKKAFHTCRQVSFGLASLGNDAGVYGAFRLALSESCRDTPSFD